MEAGPWMGVLSEIGTMQRSSEGREGRPVMLDGGGDG